MNDNRVITNIYIIILVITVLLLVGVISIAIYVDKTTVVTEEVVTAVVNDMNPETKSSQFMTRKISCVSEEEEFVVEIPEDYYLQLSVGDKVVVIKTTSTPRHKDAFIEWKLVLTQR